MRDYIVVRLEDDRNLIIYESEVRVYIQLNNGGTRLDLIASGGAVSCEPIEVKTSIQDILKQLEQNRKSQSFGSSSNSREES